MLVLTRKTEEGIRIGQDITVRILRIKKRSVQIGIEASDGVVILRNELIDAPARQARACPLVPRERRPGGTP